VARLNSQLDAIHRDRGNKKTEADIDIVGEVFIPAATPAFRGATAHVSLERIRGADAPAEIIAEITVQGVEHEPGGSGSSAPFKVRVAAAEFSRKYDYAIRAWVDLDSDGKPARGDLYSDERYSILPDQLERVIRITVFPH
jgi:uncharacterized lipoprotein YbaY